ncbi:CHC2 zinc finger domain-containing protein [Acidocella sp.]|uniref:CHC2 zinc finger domain-containing protein n=1 Tax=Acidocella sp. TaxID=50710 RepID=UPI00260F41BA|nr:CHC2 zinc finger domain-containing protein [Acidocella sp.]
MARIPALELERLKAEVSLVRLVEDAGIKLARRGKDWVACCPFHAEDTASLVVTPEKNLFHCFGCGAAGGPVDWVMKRNGVSFRHAVELLREGLPSVTDSAVKRTTMRSLPPPVSFDADDQALLNQVVDYYHETLKQSPEALAYLQTRGLVHGELIEKFRLGYANRTLGLRLPEKTRKAGAEMRARLERIGIYRESGHEHFNGSLVAPILDAGGNVTELYGRKLRDDLRPGTPKHLYLPGPHRGVWNLDGIAGAGEEIILTESLIDEMAFWCAGFRNVTACYGTGGLTEDHLAAFRGAGILRVLIAFDRDEAGERGVGEVSERLRKEGFCSYRVEFPKGMDAAEYALKVTPAAKSLGVLIRKAVWLGQGQAPATTSAPRDVLFPDPPPSSTETTGPAPINPQPSPIPPLAAKEEKTPEAEPTLPPPPAPPLPAARIPAPAQDIPAEVSETETVLSFGDRRWRVRGLARNLAHDVLKVNLLASCGASFHVDALDLYNARARTSFLTQAALELQVPEDVLKADLGRVLLKLEELQDEAIKKALAPKLAEAVTMDDEARQVALALLKGENLLERILADFDACGIAGEATNKLVGYLASVSRKLSAPLAVVIQSSSAAGKSALMEAVLAFVPPEERVQYSAMTGQSLFYMGEISLKHRILALAEEEGAARASYALKLLQSEGELTIASTGSDPKTGNLVTQEYRVEGPVMLMMTTTAIDIDEELMNRCLVLAVDEDREQTRAIHRLQRQKRTLAGLVRRHEKQAILDLHRNAQRLLRPLAVVNPFADRLTFLDDRTRTRRDHEKYLTLIDAITLLHQHQRPVRSAVVAGRVVEYVETTLADIEMANRLAHEVLGRSLDELPPQTRRMLAVIAAHVQETARAKAIRPGDVRFSRADIRRRAGLADTQCRLHLDRLAALEFLLTHRGSRGQSFEYELLFDGDIAAGAPHLPGLIGVDSLCSAPMTASSRGESPELAGPSRGHGGAEAAPSRVAKSPAKPEPAKNFGDSPEPAPESHPLKVNGHAGSYKQTAILPLAASA